MHISISGNVKTKAELEKYIEKELQEVGKKYFSNAVSAIVHFNKQGNFVRANIVINEGSKRDMTIKSNGESADISSAFELALRKISTQLRKYNNKLKEYRRIVAKSKEENRVPETIIAQNYYISDDEVVDEEFIDDYIEDAKENLSRKTRKDALNIVSEKQISIETLSVKEAIMKMDLMASVALVFKNKESGRINVIYRRGDGNIAWIDTKEK